MTDTHEKLYGIILDTQKQIGNISRETGEQTTRLKAIDDKQDVLNEYQKTANSKMAKAILDIGNLQTLTSDYPEVKKGYNEVLTTKKAAIMIGSIVFVVTTAFWGITKYAAKSYLNELLSEKGYDLIEIQR